MIGSHLAHDPGAGRGSRIAARLLGTPELGLRTRTAQVVRATEAEDPRTVLDVGCGAGFTSLTLAARNASLVVLGVDVNALQVARARAIAESAGLANATFVDSLDDVPRQAFDVGLCVDTLEYVPDDAALLEAIAARLRPGGLLVVHCRRIPTPRVLGRFRALDPRFDGRLRAGYDRSSLEALVTGVHLQVESVRETMRATAELAFEATHAEHGLVRGRAARYALLPLLLPLARADTLGEGAGLLLTARRAA